MKRHLSTLDRTISQQLNVSRASRWWHWARFVAHLGDGFNVFGALALAFMLGWLVRATALQFAGVVIILDVVVTMIVVTLIKYSVRRKRPAAPGEFAIFRYDKYSFPSGHSARMAAVTGGTLGFFPAIGLLLISVTLGVALARVAVGVHYFSDIFVGLCLGGAISGSAHLLVLFLGFSMI